MKKRCLGFVVASIAIGLGTRNFCATDHHDSIFISGNAFKSIADHCFDETTPTLFDSAQVRPYDIIFVKVDYVLTFFEKLHPRIPEKYILITHNGDLSPVFLTTNNSPTREQRIVRYLDDPKLVVWFAQNIDYQHPKLKPIPIGIANAHWPHGNVVMFRDAQRNIPPLDARHNKAYLNFIVHSNTQERKPTLEYFRRKPFVYVASFKESKLYLDEVKQYRYVISPQGNGADCHRTWEALLMGCIPVVKHSLLDPLFEGLPVILVDQWSEVTQEFLDRKYAEIKAAHFTSEKIYAEYWINLIKGYQQAP